jgi:hypothetical protein
MKHIKLFENFKINENTEEEMKPKMFISNDGVLTIKTKDITEKIKMEDGDKTGTSRDGSLVIKSAADQTADADNRVFKCSVWRTKYGNIKKAYAELGWDLKVNDIGNTRKDEMYLYVATPVGYSGKGKATWGFYNIEELKSEAVDSVPAYKDIDISKREIDVVTEKIKKVIIKDGFDYDSFELSDAAKKEIKSKLEPVKDKIRGVWITTGASQDADPEEEIEKKGKKVKRSEWDSYLVKNRYNKLGSYLKELGVTPKVSKAGKKEGGEFKVYGVFDEENLKSDENRTILIKPVYK